MTGRLLAFECCYIGGKAVSAVIPAFKHRTRCQCLDLEPIHWAAHGGLIYESKESAGERTRNKTERYF